MNPPPAMPPTLHAKAAWAWRHPKERRYVGRSVVLSVAIHLLFAALVCVLAYWCDLRLKDLLSKGGSIAESGPAPEQPMTVNLVMTEPRPPPAPPPKATPAPTPQALPVLPPVQLKIVTPVPAPTPVPSPAIVAAPAKPSEKPVAKPKPRYTAAHATGEGRTPNITQARVGTSGLPAPNYPADALALRERGTVGMEVVFGPDGRVMNAEVQQSSGFSILDYSTRRFICAHWKNASLANTTIHIPIIYEPSGSTVEMSTASP